MFLVAIDHSLDIWVLKLLVISWFMIIDWIWSTWHWEAGQTTAVCASSEALTPLNSHCQRSGWHWVTCMWIWDISAIKTLAHERNISATDSANWAGPLVSPNKMKDAHKSLQCRGFCVFGSDAKVRRMFWRSVISFQLEFLPANLLGWKAVTIYGRKNRRGVTILPCFWIKEQSKNLKKYRY